MKKVAILFGFSLLVVSLGQPQTSAILSLVASAMGFALFWISSTYLKRWRFLYSLIWFFFVQLVQLSWLASTTYQGLYILFVYVGLSLALGLQFGVLSIFFPRKPVLTVCQSLGMAALWTLMEWSRVHVLCGFVWNPVGLSHAASSIGAQMATIWGIFGLSFWVMFVNLLAVRAFFDRCRKSVCLWSGALLLPYFFGVCHMQYHKAKSVGSFKPINVALVQTALLPDQKTYFRHSKEQYVSPYRQWKNILCYLRQHRSKKLDLIVLPEAALPYSAYTPVYNCKEVKRIMETFLGGVDLSPLLIKPLAAMRGGEVYVSNAFWAQAISNYYNAEVVIGFDDCDKGNYYNAAFHFIPGRRAITRYEKRVLVPLAEYLPFSFLKPLIKRYGIHNFCTHGKEAKVIDGKCPLSISICYEECFSHLMREGRQKGAQLFVNVTNDAWYPFSRLPQQHFDHGRIRAIENGVPLVRACNTGVTVGVDSLGRIIDELKFAEREHEVKGGSLFLSVDLYTFPTLYTIWGDSFIVVLSFVCLTFLRRGRGFSLDEN